MHTQNRVVDDIEWIIKRFRSTPPILIKRINKTGKIRMKSLIKYGEIRIMQFEAINACACVFFFPCHMFKACRFQSVSQLIVEALFVEALGSLVVVRQVSTYL
ncbi:hypothetical protein T01_4175 [Trichinella spiralis]|uniref:Uncharacterized protein n=1 Tax=Trichinella spiralis TaxID=6334 RepID=A0A0V1AQZ1_TRISP|nr:hypothetical protein T01_4175 [Trichinella spiralis]